MKIIQSSKAYYAVPKEYSKRSHTMPWRRLTIKLSRNATARTVRRNASRILLVQKLGDPRLLQCPA